MFVDRQRGKRFGYKMQSSSRPYKADNVLFLDFNSFHVIYVVKRWKIVKKKHFSRLSGENKYLTKS
jgi:hypothetical protein